MTSTPTFPVALLLEGRPCLVIGSGSQIEARLRALCAAGARLRVVTSTPTEHLQNLAQSGQLELYVRAFDAADFQEVWLALSVGLDRNQNQSAFDYAQRARVFFCAVDQPAYCSYFHVAIARAGALSVAISTAGSVPALAKRLREELERVFNESGLAGYVAELAVLRQGLPEAERVPRLTQLVQKLKLTGSISWDK